MGFTGNDYDLDGWPPMPHGVSEFKPIHTSRHIHVSKYHRDVCATFQYCDRLVSVSRLDRDKAASSTSTAISLRSQSSSTTSTTGDSFPVIPSPEVAPRKKRRGR
jgi:hypothetical protein